MFNIRFLFNSFLLLQSICQYNIRAVFVCYWHLRYKIRDKFLTKGQFLAVVLRKFFIFAKNQCSMPYVFLSIGSNLGNREQNIINAIATIGSDVGVVRRVSEFIDSEPQGFESDNKFLNAAILVITCLKPLDLLYKLQEIEISLGRISKSDSGYTDRIIDIDILLYDNDIVDLPQLKIPHPLMMERDFVLIPLREIAPNLLIFKR